MCRLYVSCILRNGVSVRIYGTSSIIKANDMFDSIIRTLRFHKKSIYFWYYLEDFKDATVRLYTRKSKKIRREEKIYWNGEKK